MRVEERCFPSNEKWLRDENGIIEGGVVNSSRGILFPAGAKGAEDAATWEQAFDAALDSAIDELGNAIRR